MKELVPQRLRSVALLAATAVAVIVIGGATRGWSTVADIVPVPIVVVAALFILGRRDSDTGALIRHHLDERQEHERLKVQAFVGRVLSIAVAIAYTVAWATETKLWPWAALLAVMAAAFVAGRLMYGPHGSQQIGDDAA